MKQQNQCGPEQKSSNRLETCLRHCSWPWLFATAGARQTKLFCSCGNERAGLGEGSLAYTASRWTVGCATHTGSRSDWRCNMTGYAHNRHTHTHARTYAHTHTSHIHTFSSSSRRVPRRPHFRLAYKFVRTHAMWEAWTDRIRQSKAWHSHTQMQLQHQHEQLQSIKATKARNSATSGGGENSANQHHRYELGINDWLDAVKF